MSPKTNTVLFEKYRVWLSTPLEERGIKTQRDWAFREGLNEMTLVGWKHKILGVSHLSQNVLFMRQVYEQAMKPNATASQMELYAKLKGLLIEKKESVNVNLTADDYYRIRQEARRKAERVPEQSGGDRSLQPESTLLPQELCVDTKQELREDGQVATLGSPTQST